MPGLDGFEKMNALPPVEKSEEQPMAEVDAKMPEDLKSLLKNIKS